MGEKLYTKGQIEGKKLHKVTMNFYALVFRLTSIFAAIKRAVVPMSCSLCLGMFVFSDKYLSTKSKAK